MESKYIDTYGYLTTFLVNGYTKIIRRQFDCAFSNGYNEIPSVLHFDIGEVGEEVTVASILATIHQAESLKPFSPVYYKDGDDRRPAYFIDANPFCVKEPFWLTTIGEHCQSEITDEDLFSSSNIEVIKDA